MEQKTRSSYLASVLATHAQKGLPAFGIYGHDVQEADDTSIPADVEENYSDSDVQQLQQLP